MKLQHFRIAEDAFTLRRPADSEPMTLSGLAVPYGREFSRWGQRYRFDTLRTAEPLSTLKLLVEHDPERVIGYAVDATHTETGLHLTFAVPETPLGAATVDEVRAMLRDGFSVGVELDDLPEEMSDDVVVLTGVVRETSVVSVPQFNESRAAAAAELLTLTVNERRESNMNERRIATDAPAGTVNEAVAGFRIEDAPAFLELAARVDAIETSGRPAHPLSGYASLAAAMLAGVAPDAQRLTLALADNTSESGANAGVIGPAWLTRVVGLIERRRVAITAFGGPNALPAEGMSTSWPYFDGDLTDYVGVQTAQKTEVTSAAVNIKAANAAIKTYAGAADNALQLIERSSPSFLEAWGRIMLAAYAVVTDSDFVAAVAAAGVPGQAPPVDAQTTKAWLFNASDAVDDATGAPAGFALAAPDVFRWLGTMPDLVTPEYGTVNTPGVASAAELRVNVSGLPILKARGLAAGTLIASNTEAARFMEDGPSFIDAPNVARLGRDTAIYGYGASHIYVPAGVVKTTGIVTDPAPDGTGRGRHKG